jgi:hypothetical protein
MEAIRSSETSVQSTISTWRHTPEDGILHSHRRENLKSYISFSLFMWLNNTETRVIYNVVYTIRNSIQVTWKREFFLMALPAHSGPRPLIQFRNHFSQTVGLIGRVISPSQGRYLNTGQHKHKINAYIHQTSMPRVECEPTSPASERAKTVHALDRTAAMTGYLKTGVIDWKSVKICRIEFQQYLEYSVWDAWKISFMALCKLCFFMDECGRKSER